VILAKARKRAIAKALQLEGHPDFAPVDLAYIISMFWVFCSKIFRFGKFRLATLTTNADHVTPRPFSTLKKQEIRTDFESICYNLRCLLHTL